jgi:hypothetical protein
LDTVRNALLAHTRTKDGELLDVWALINTESAPMRHAEVILLAVCATDAVATAICRHQKERDEAVASLEEKRRSVREPTSGASTWDDIFAETAAIRAEIVAADSALAAKFDGQG